MIRLAVIGAFDSRLEAIAPRLRGATLDAAAAPACDGAVFFDWQLGAIDGWLQAGKPVMVAAEGGLTREILQTRSGQANLTIANSERYLPSRQLIRQQLDAGKLGAPGLVRMHRWTPDSPPPPTRKRPTREESLLHDLDLVLWYAGAVPNVVYAVGHARGVQLHLGFSGGGMALLEQAAMPADDSYCSLAVIGAHGAAYADDHQNMQLAFRGGAPQAIRADEGLGQWVAMLQEFIDRIAGLTTARSESCPTWNQVLTVADAVETSLRTKEAVALKGAP